MITWCSITSNIPLDLPLRLYVYIICRSHVKVDPRRGGLCRPFGPLLTDMAVSVWASFPFSLSLSLEGMVAAGPRHHGDPSTVEGEGCSLHLLCFACRDGAQKACTSFDTRSSLSLTCNLFHSYRACKGERNAVVAALTNNPKDVTDTNSGRLHSKEILHRKVLLTGNHTCNEKKCPLLLYRVFLPQTFSLYLNKSRWSLS